MSGLVTPALGAVAALVSAVGGPAATTALQNRRVHRLRSSISDNMKLRSELSESALNFSDDQMAGLDQLIRDQASALVARDRAWLTRRRDWSSLGIVIFLVSVFVPILWWMRWISTWWSLGIFWILAVTLLAFCAVGTWMTFFPDNSKSEETVGVIPSEQAASTTSPAAEKRSS